MPFSQEKYDHLTRAIRFALVSTSLNEWERKFLRDMQAKLDRYGPKTNLSKKQYGQLMKLTRDKTVQKGSTVYPRRTKAPSHRRQGYRRNWRPTFGSVLAVCALSLFLIYKGAERFPEYLGPVVAMSSTQDIVGRVTHVRDGDTIEVEGVPIRFGSLNCDERGTSNGQRATARMRSLISGQTLTCYLNGRTSYDRKIGSCQLQDGRDLGGIMIGEGYCRRFW